jgi:DNA-binding NtrC family response regulator
MPTEVKETQPLPVRGSISRTKRMSRVLVVDDETAIVDAICEFLDLQNITTDKANDGGEALQLLSKNRYDAIISDIRMPGVDGPQLYERSVAMDPNYKSRFLFMSGDLVRDSTQGFVQSLNCPCLAKPFALQVLYQNLEPLLNGSGENGHGGGNGSAPPYPGPDLTSSGSFAKTVRIARPSEM